MKPQVLERARASVEAYLRKQYADAALDVLSVDSEVDGDGDEFLWISLKYDDSAGGKGVPDSSTRIEMKDRLRTELRDAEVEGFPVFSFIAASEVESDVIEQTFAEMQSKRRLLKC